MLKLADVTCFVRTVQTGSFTAASRILGLTPQMVGKQVAALEADVGVALLARSTRKQNLTQAGEAFYAQCLVLLREAETAEALAAEFGDAPRGRLVLTAPTAFGTLRLMPFIGTYLERCPGVTVKLVLTDRPVDIIGEGFDAALRLGPLQPSSLKVRKLGRFHLAAYAAPSYIAAHGLPVRPTDLTSHECLIFDYASKAPLVEWMFEKDGQTETVRVKGRLQMNDGRAVIEAALAGYGVVLQDETILDPHVEAGRLVRLFPGYVGPHRNMSLLFPATRVMTPTLRSLIDALAKHFAKA